MGLGDEFVDNQLAFVPRGIPPNHNFGRYTCFKVTGTKTSANCDALALKVTARSGLIRNRCHVKALSGTGLGGALAERPHGRVEVRAFDPRLVMAGLFVLALAPLLVTPVLPLIDIYDHIARFHVLSRLDDPLLAANYRAHWSLVPDIGLDVISTPLLAVVPPLIAGHLVAALVMATVYGGVLYFNRMLTGKTPLFSALLLLPLLYSYVLNWGFVNFLLGLGFSFWAAGWWIANRSRPLFANTIGGIFALLIFFCHGVAFALYGILLAALELGFFLRARKKRARDFAVSLLLLAAQAVVPALLFLMWERGLGHHGTLAAKSGLSPHDLLASMFVRPGHPGTHRLATILRVEEGPAYWFDIVTFFLQMGLVWFLYRRKQVVLAAEAWPLLAVSLVLVWLCPPIMFGVDYVADRMPLFAALVLLGALGLAPTPRDRTRAAVIGTLTAIVVLRLAVTAWDWHGYAAQFREYESVTADLPKGSLSIGVAVGSGHHESSVPRCEMYGPLLIARQNQIGPLFSTQGQHPLLVQGRVEPAMNFFRGKPVPNETTRDYNPYLGLVADAGFDNVLICNTQLLSRPFPANFRVVRETPHFALLHVVR